MKVLYYDCFSGISGDMHLGAMIDAGVDPNHLRSELHKLPLSGYRLDIDRARKNSIEGTLVKVIEEDGHESHNYEVSHSRDHHHVHRNLSDIEEIIRSSSLPEATRSRALNMFRLIATAEARVHGVPVEQIHFHEVGAVDSIVDITGAAICLEYLKPDRILSSPVELGGGTITCAHGIMPVPAPATSEILKDIPVKLGNTDHEATTPTGAAILAANVDEFTDQLHFSPGKIAYGLGQREAKLPNVLRIYLGEINKEQHTTEESILLECNVDDMSPEDHGYVMDLLFDQGASDVYLTPIIMKKSRPAVTISVLCEESIQQIVTETLFKHTTTLGIRSHPVSKNMLKRRSEKVSTTLGPVTIKKAWSNGKLLKWKPEYEDCKSIADRNGWSLQQVRSTIEPEIAQMITREYENS